MRYSRKSAGILSLLLLFNSIGMNACGQATAETGHVSISMTGMENTPVINYTVPTLTPNVLVDQQGYAAVGEKQAVVKGRQPVETFRLVDRETGETVYEGTVKQTDYNGELSLYIGTADFTDSVIRRMTRISMECLVGLCRKDNGCRAKTKEYGPGGIAYSLKNAKFAGKIYWI